HTDLRERLEEADPFHDDRFSPVEARGDDRFQFWKSVLQPLSHLRLRLAGHQKHVCLDCRHAEPPAEVARECRLPRGLYSIHSNQEPSPGMECVLYATSELAMTLRLYRSGNPQNCLRLTMSWNDLCVAEFGSLRRIRQFRIQTK